MSEKSLRSLEESFKSLDEQRNITPEQHNVENENLQSIRTTKSHNEKSIHQSSLLEVINFTLNKILYK